MANRLINEQSPYLLQHAHNPVDWYPWGDEAFEQARAQDRPVLVSIGYAACHWCHVMERESFEDATVAAYMNEHFICVKVDREEHPDVDHFYMDAVQAIGGSGGWPLNVFVTPDRAPFYGGTYYPPRPAYNRPSWSQLLGRINEIWHEQHGEVTAQAQQMLDHLRNASGRIVGERSAAPDTDAAAQIAKSLLAMADKEKGGFGNAPKFPGTMAISFLIEHYRYTGNEEALKHALRSLDAMIDGGIYDQLGGGFARYSTDADWLAPHFEKMLYDNALLIISLCDAYGITGNKRYAEVVEETIAFADRELSNREGGYYCALDADSEGIEGKFYTWTWEEWQQHSGDDHGIAASYFGVREHGNWEETNILHVAQSPGDVARQHGIDEREVLSVLESVKSDLFNARELRIRPATDDKSLLSWNALMNLALTRAARSLGREDYRLRAIEHMNWMLGAYKDGSDFLHSWKGGVARIPSKLDDLAYLVSALLHLSSLSGDEQYAVQACDMLEAIISDYGREDGFFYYTPEKQADMPVRKVDVYDGALPSANSVMAQNLWLGGMLSGRQAWIEQSAVMVRAMAATASRYAYSFANWGLQLQRHAASPKVAVCSGAGAESAVNELGMKAHPHLFTIACKKEISELPLLHGKFVEGALSIFVCSDEACLSPAANVENALKLV
ncbi:MAG: thioredoxin domain-containing protein [Taibaiella sp.]|nr:thioredoxin domain-containing protein [Taibaiella sp.]